MRTLSLLVLLTIVGCASFQPAEMISATYKPAKSGILKMGEGRRDLVRKNASAIMEKFCAPQVPEISKIDNVSTANGARVIPLHGGFRAVKTTFENAQMISFDCVDESLLSEK